MEDNTGLQEGAADLRDQELLLDFTIKVQGHEFKVHKFVLASVSDYFRAMICGSMSESTNDMVELKEINAQHMSELLDFIYGGSLFLVDENPKAFLELAVYFQMPKVIERCRLRLRSILRVKNCVDILATFKTYSMDKDVTKVNKFIKEHVPKVIQHYKVQEITPDVMTILLDNWNQSEWDMFLYVQSWISAKCENWELYANDFMNHVRFSIMPPQQIKKIKEMDWFKESEGAWKDLVEKAFVHHDQTTLLKVAADSNQSSFRFGKSAFLLNIGAEKDGKTEVSVIVKDERNVSQWKTRKSIESPEVTGKLPFVLEANNFLITCSEFGENQSWQVFDPLALTWTRMPDMPTPKDGFTMVYHDKNLYVLGGTTGSNSEKCLTDTIDEYSFETNSWSSTKKLPVAVKNHSACVLDGSIYISGGEVAKGNGFCKTAKMYRLDNNSQKWENKASLHREMANHKMCVMTVNKRQVIVVIDIDNKLNVRHYSPGSNQWSKSDMSLSILDEDESDDIHDHPYKSVQNLKWSRESMMLVDGNIVYLLNLHGEEWREYETEYWEEERDSEDFEETTRLCVKWRVDYNQYEEEESEEEDDSDADSWITTKTNESDEEKEENMSKTIEICAFAMADFPYGSGYSFWSTSCVNAVGGVLAFPADAKV